MAVDEFKVVDISDPEKYSREGTLSAMFLPADNYKFSGSGQLHRLVVPKEGTLPSEDGSDLPGKAFNISPKNGVVLFGDLLKVMFALKAYPALEEKQRFVICAVEVTLDKVAIVGEVITFE